MTADTTERLPNPSEIAADSLDGRYAIKHFHGKTLTEAQELFAEGNALPYTEDLLWMEPIGFRFYIRAAISFCLSERATADSDLISGLAGTISLWHEQHPGELVPCARLLADFCSAVVEQFDRYDADPEIYVGLRDEYQQLAELFTVLSNAPGNV